MPIPFMYSDGDSASANSLGLSVTLGTALNVSADEVATGASASVTGGCSIFRVTSSTSSTYPSLIKSTAGRLYGFEIVNFSALTTQFAKLHDSNVTPTASSPVLYTVTMPCGINSGLSLVEPARIWFDQGISFTSGLGFRMTRGGADANDQSVGTGEMTAHIFYK